jgi:hypothetical protein
MVQIPSSRPAVSAVPWPARSWGQGRSPKGPSASEEPGRRRAQGYHVRPPAFFMRQVEFKKLLTACGGEIAAEASGPRAKIRTSGAQLTQNSLRESEKNP